MDIQGMLDILHAVQSGQIAVREVYLDSPSPMSLPMQWRVEAEEMYEYSPTTPASGRLCTMNCAILKN